jgi:superfamily II DNA or RNA helicase
LNEYAYVTATGKLIAFFNKTIHDVKVPLKVDENWLATVGYTDIKNDRRLIPVLKELGFIRDDGTTTQIYIDYRDKNKSKEVMENALKGAYAELYSTYEDPFKIEDEKIINFIKTKKNSSQNTAELATKTFKGLASASGIIENSTITKQKHPRTEKLKISKKGDIGETHNVEKEVNNSRKEVEPISITINIQFVLPTTSDREVYSSLFSELRKFISKEKQNEP